MLAQETYQAMERKGTFGACPQLLEMEKSGIFERSLAGSRPMTACSMRSPCLSLRSASKPLHTSKPSERVATAAGASNRPKTAPLLHQGRPPSAPPSSCDAGRNAFSPVRGDLSTSDEVCYLSCFHSLEPATWQPRGTDGGGVGLVGARTNSHPLDA